MERCGRKKEDDVSVDLRVCCGCVMWKVIVMWF